MEVKGFKRKTDIKKIKKLRKLNKMTQLDLAERSGIALSTIKSIETGRIELSEKNVELLSSIFNTPANDFYYLVNNDSKTISLYDKERNTSIGSKVVELKFEIPSYLEDLVIHRVRELVESVR